MAEADFAPLDDILDGNSVKKGVTAGFTPPDGGGVFTAGFHSVVTTAGASGYFIDPGNNLSFAPLENDALVATGGSVRAAIRRVASAGPTDFAPFVFICLQGTSVNDQGYLLGLSDNDPHEIILRKGAPVGGLRPDASGVLRTGSVTYIPDTWVHVRLDCIVNPNGDVVLKAFYNDLDTNPVTAPVWAAVPGMTDFIDDALGINASAVGATTTPFSGGYVGFGFQTNATSRRALFDQLEVFRQV